MTKFGRLNIDVKLLNSNCKEYYYKVFVNIICNQFV